MIRSEVFERRHRVYWQLDRKLCSRTRFFAAAAFTNAVLAQLFRFVPLRKLCDAYGLLRDGGAVLEAANLQFAHDLDLQGSSEVELDQFLVCSEQRLLQAFLELRIAEAGCQWPLIRTQLNELLNEQHLAAKGACWLGPGRQFGGIVRAVRTGLGVPVDFAIESHRIQIGFTIICHIRQGLVPVISYRGWRPDAAGQSVGSR